MDEVVIYGASDDLIEIESKSFRNEEFNVDSYGSYVVAVSDGSVFRVRYDEDGIWRFTPIVIGSSGVTIEQGQDDKRHSDRVVLTGDSFRWVVLGIEIAK